MVYAALGIQQFRQTIVEFVEIHLNEQIGATYHPRELCT
jgi:hypothetical protein